MDKGLSPFCTAALAALCAASTAFGLTIEESFSYDANGRLSGVEVTGRPDLSQSYEYDASGNLARQSIGGETVTMTYDKANQVSSRRDAAGITYYDYDGAGRLIRERQNGKTVAQYEYGYLDKVTAVERAGQRTEFYYDAKGMLAGKKLSSGETEAWAWDGIALAARGDTVYVNEGHISGGVPVMSRTVGSGETTFYESDYLGNTVGLHRDGKVDPVLATPFGHSLDKEVRSGLDANADRRFTGKPYDADLAGFVFPYRNYSTTTSRWTTADPSGFPDGPNRHFYAPVPTTGLDPWGLETQDFWRSGFYTYSEANYDIWDVISHTVTVEWNQQSGGDTYSFEVGGSKRSVTVGGSYTDGDLTGTVTSITNNFGWVNQNTSSASSGFRLADYEPASFTDENGNTWEPVGWNGNPNFSQTGPDTSTTGGGSPSDGYWLYTINETETYSGWYTYNEL